MTESTTHLKRPRPRPRLSLDIQHVDETHQRFPSSNEQTNGVVAPPTSTVAADEPDRHMRQGEGRSSDNDDAAEKGDVFRPVSASNIVSDLANTLVTLGNVGRGTSGAVNVGVHVHTGQLVAIKQITMLDNEHRSVLGARETPRPREMHPGLLARSLCSAPLSCVDASRVATLVTAYLQPALPPSLPWPSLTFRNAKTTQPRMQRHACART